MSLWVRSPPNSIVTAPSPSKSMTKALRALPISGIVDAYDTDSFAAYLATLNGVIVQKTPTHIRVLSTRHRWSRMPLRSRIMSR